MVRYVRLSIRGIMLPGEVWSINPVLDPSGEIPGDFDQARFDAFTLALAGIALPTPLRALLTTQGGVTSFAAQLRDTSSDTMLGQSIYDLPAALDGTGTPTKPIQTALVCSLRTATPQASGRGRLYWPAVGAGISASTFRLNNPTTGDVAEAMSSYLTDICDAAQANLTTGGTIPFGVSVYSPTKRTLTPVTKIMVGDVLDVQRRRRDALAETYATEPFPTP